MGTRNIIAGAANFAANRSAVEFPAVANLAYAAFFGDGSLNSQDGANLGSSGAFTPIGTGPVLHPGYGTFTKDAAALQTQMADVDPSTHLWVFRGSVAYAVIGGVCDATPSWFTSLIFNDAAPSYTVGWNTDVQNGAGNLASLPLNSWLCVAATIGPVTTGVCNIYNLTGNTVGPNQTRIHGAVAANWQIGSTPRVIANYNHPIDIAFAMGAGTLLTLTQLQTVYAALKLSMANRGITI